MDIEPDRNYSIEDVYKEISASSSEGFKFSIYFSLVRVGLVVLAASGMLFTISMLLFAPTFSFIPYGRSGQVLLGIVGTAFAVKIYNLYKLSSRTFLIAGRDPVGGGGGKIWRSTSKSSMRRFISSILFFILAINILSGTLYLFAKWNQATGYNADGFFAKLNPELDFLLFISVFLLLLGGILIFSGFILAAWILSTIFRSFFLIFYWRLKNKAVRLLFDRIEKYTGISLSAESKVICPICYNNSFKFRGNRSQYNVDYEIRCSQCSNDLDSVYSSVKRKSNDGRVINQ